LPASAATIAPAAPATTLQLLWPGPPGSMTFNGGGSPISDHETGSDGRFVSGTASGMASIGILGAEAAVVNSDAAPYDPVTADETGSTVFATWRDAFSAYFPGSGSGYLQFNFLVTGTTTGSALHNSTNTPPILPQSEFTIGALNPTTGDAEQRRLFGAGGSSLDVAIQFGDPGEFINMSAELNVVAAAYSLGTLTADDLDPAGFTSVELLDANRNFIEDVTLTDVSGQHTLALLGAASPVPVPEPGSVLLVAGGLLLLAGRRGRGAVRRRRLVVASAAVGTIACLTAPPVQAQTIVCCQLTTVPTTDIFGDWPGAPPGGDFVTGSGPIMRSDSGSDGTFGFGAAFETADIGTLGAAITVTNTDARPFGLMTDRVIAISTADWSDTFSANFPFAPIFTNGFIRFTVDLRGSTTVTAAHTTINTPPYTPLPIQFAFEACDDSDGCPATELYLTGAGVATFDLPIFYGVPGDQIMLGAGLDVYGGAYSAGGVSIDYYDTATISSIELLDSAKNFLSDVTLTDLAGTNVIGLPTAPEPAPEPGTMPLLAVGLFLCVWYRIRRTTRI